MRKILLKRCLLLPFLESNDPRKRIVFRQRKKTFNRIFVRWWNKIK
jgi:hypothetical protein